MAGEDQSDPIPSADGFRNARSFSRLPLLLHRCVMNSEAESDGKAWLRQGIKQ